jgi:hypothetical protein
MWRPSARAHGFHYGECRAHLSELGLAVGDQAACWPEEELTIEVTTMIES